MKELIEALSRIENNPEIERSQYLTDGDHDELHPDVRSVVELACEELITNNGDPNFAAREVLGEEGFRVVAGETDSFGWLTGVIITTKGRIVYG